MALSIRLYNDEDDRVLERWAALCSRARDAQTWGERHGTIIVETYNWAALIDEALRIGMVTL